MAMTFRTKSSKINLKPVCVVNQKLPKILLILVLKNKSMLGIHYGSDKIQ